MNEREYTNTLPSDKPTSEDVCDFCERELEGDELFTQEWSGRGSEAEYALACPDCVRAHHSSGNQEAR